MTYKRKQGYRMKITEREVSENNPLIQALVFYMENVGKMFCRSYDRFRKKGSEEHEQR